MAETLIGTAGWSIPAAYREAFPGRGSHLGRYATRFDAVEINSSFYRPHRRTTYQRWAASVGRSFRFSVKLPKTLSHAPDGASRRSDIDQFADGIEGLGEKLGVVLIQFPPSRVYREGEARPLFDAIAARVACPLVCEPRHASWFEPAAEALLSDLRIARVSADPPRAAGVQVLGGHPDIRYHRLHGSPRIYYSAYDKPALASLRSTIAVEACSAAAVWCIFDNTAVGAATANALDLTA